MKKIMFLSVLLLSVVLGSFTSFADQKDIDVIDANEITISNDLKLEIKESLDELGIDETTQDSLINKLEKGEIWDSMDKEQVSQIPEDYFNVSEKEPVKRYTFPDGSVIEQKIEIPTTKSQSNISPSAISGGSVVSGSGYTTYKGVKVSKTSGLMGMGFYANYTFVQGGSDIIESVYDRWVKVVGGSYSVDTFQITRKTEVSGNPATAKLIADISWVGGVTGSGTEWLYLNVGNDRAWSTQN